MGLRQPLEGAEAYVQSGKTRESIVTGFGESGRVVTAAAIIMTAVFGAFVLADDPVTKSIGLSLAVGVLADAFIVRMTLVPAVMALLGDRAWHLPGWLDRRLPNLDIEGAGLERGGHPADPAPAPEPVAESADPVPEEPVTPDEPAPGTAGAG